MPEIHPGAVKPAMDGSVAMAAGAVQSQEGEEGGEEELIYREDSSVTKAEALEHHHDQSANGGEASLPPSKRIRLDGSNVGQTGRRKGVAPIKAEWVSFD